MKKGLLVALFGLALVATLALPQTASAATPWPNTAIVDSIETASGPVSPFATISDTAIVFVLGTASLAMVKQVDNLNRDPVGVYTSTVEAVVGDVVKYRVTLVNLGEDEITMVNFVDQIPPGLQFCDALNPNPDCEDPIWDSPTLGVAAPLQYTAGPETIEDSPIPGEEIRVNGGGLGFETYLTYTAIVQ